MLNPHPCGAVCLVRHVPVWRRPPLAGFRPRAHAEVLACRHLAVLDLDGPLCAPGSLMTTGSGTRGRLSSIRRLPAPYGAPRVSAVPGDRLWQSRRLPVRRPMGRSAGRVPRTGVPMRSGSPSQKGMGPAPSLPVRTCPSVCSGTSVPGAPMAWQGSSWRRSKRPSAVAA